MTNIPELIAAIREAAIQSRIQGIGIILTPKDALVLCEAVECYQRMYKNDCENIINLTEQLAAERLAKEAAEAKLSKMGRLLDFAEQANDASTEKEVALSASFQEAMAHEMLAQVEAELAAERLAKEAVEKVAFQAQEMAKEISARLDMELKERDEFKRIAEMETGRSAHIAAERNALLRDAAMSSQPPPASHINVDEPQP